MGPQRHACSDGGESHTGARTVTNPLLQRTLARLSEYSPMCNLRLSGTRFEAERQQHAFSHGLGNFSLWDIHGRPINVSVPGSSARMGDHGSNHAVVPGVMGRYEANSSTPVALRIRKKLGLRCHSFWSVADVALTLSGARAWPALLAAGCCPYPSADMNSSFLLITVRPLRRAFSVRPGIAKQLTDCSASNLNDRACALRLMDATFASLHEMLEAPLRVRLREHHQTVLSNNRQVVHFLKLGQFCQQLSDGALALCEVDQADWDPRVPNTSTALSWIRGPPWYTNQSGWMLVDTMHFLLHTLRWTRETSFVYGMVPELRAIALEVDARHRALEAGCEGVVQLSFSCAQEWLLRSIKNQSARTSKERRIPRVSWERQAPGTGRASQFLQKGSGRGRGVVAGARSRA